VIVACRENHGFLYLITLSEHPKHFLPIRFGFRVVRRQLERTIEGGTKWTG
jgi:hypothetical protein